VNTKREHESGWQKPYQAGKLGMKVLLLCTGKGSSASSLFLGTVGTALEKKLRSQKGTEGINGHGMATISA